MNTECMACHAVVTSLIEARQWALFSCEEFAHRLHLRVLETGGDHSEASLKKIATNLYCLALYEACRDDGERQERAYFELSRYLYDRAIYKYKDVDLAQEFVQEALLRIFRLIDTCNAPGAFLEFAYLKLWQAATDHFRKRDRDKQRIVNLPDYDSDGNADSSEVPLVDTDLPHVDELVITEEKAQRILTRIGELIEKHPRAKNQLLAVLLKMLYEWGDAEIAQELGTTVSNVHVLRTRGLKRLRDDPELAHLWDEL